MSQIYTDILKKTREGRKMFAWLIDPDKYTVNTLEKPLQLAAENGVDLVFIGGSLLLENKLTQTIRQVKEMLKVPVILFPGNSMQINENADGLLYLSLISGRNADFLIGRHVESSFMLKNSNLEVLPTGYILVDTGSPTTVSYISNTTPLPYEKHEIAVSTAIAGEMLGLRLIFLEGGSGALKPVSPEMVNAVKKHISVPLIVGGGIEDANQMKAILDAGADIVVVGNSIEKNADLITGFCNVLKHYHS